MCGFISGLRILFLWSMCLCLCQFHNVLIAVDFVVYSDVRDHDFSSSVLLSQDCFGYSVFFISIQILKLFVLVLWKFYWNFNEYCIESVDCLGQYGHFNNKNSSSSRTLYIFPTAYIAFSFFHQYLTVFGVQSFTSLTTFISGYFILFDAMEMGLFP